MSSSENSRGALLMSLAMAVFVCNDALTKFVTAELTTAQIMVIRSILTMGLIYGAARYKGISLGFETLRDPVILLRTLFDVFATAAYLYALAHMEFAAMTSIMQSLPLVVTLGAALFLGEPVGWRRWTAICVGLIGVLIIIKPGTDGFSWAASIAIIAILLTTCRDLLTRRINSATPTLVVSFLTCIANVVVGSVLIVPMGGWQPVSAASFGYLLIASFFVFTGYSAIVQSTRVGDVSFVAPFRYTGLLWGLVVSVLAFGERPDIYMLSGAAIVLASGLYSFYRERKKMGVTSIEKADARPPA